MKAEVKHQILVSLDIINRELKKLDEIPTKEYDSKIKTAFEQIKSKVLSIEHSLFDALAPSIYIVNRSDGKPRRYQFIISGFNRGLGKASRIINEPKFQKQKI